ncbi:MAG: NlpC/P60 family protein [Amaricoccus sp.]
MLTPPFADRLRPARPDLAADHLRGQVEAGTFVRGRTLRVTVPLLDMTASPLPGAGRTTQLLHGEAFVVYENRPDGLAWGQAELDGYVGYVRADGLGPTQAPGQRITALWSHVYAEPTARARVETELPFLASVPVKGSTGGFFRLRDGGFVPRPHMAPLAGDHVAQAERFIGVPYLWGGRSLRGLDCSALVQLALLGTGIPAPRDSDMQAALVGAPLAAGAAPRRGDLWFWKGHVAILTGPGTLIHASGHQMAVAVEPVREAVARIAASGGGPVTVRRRP